MNKKLPIKGEGDKKRTSVSCNHPAPPTPPALKLLENGQLKQS